MCECICTHHGISNTYFSKLLLYKLKKNNPRAQASDKATEYAKYDPDLCQNIMNCASVGQKGVNRICFTKTY